MAYAAIIDCFLNLKDFVGYLPQPAALMAHTLESDERRPLLDPYTSRRYDLPGGQHFFTPEDSPAGLYCFFSCLAVFCIH